MRGKKIFLFYLIKDLIDILFFLFIIFNWVFFDNFEECFFRGLNYILCFLFEIFNIFLKVKLVIYNLYLRF